MATGCIFETPDNYLVSLNAKDGKERWRVEIADLETGILLDRWRRWWSESHYGRGRRRSIWTFPGYLEARDPGNRRVQWRWNTEPQNRASRARRHGRRGRDGHGGGMTWMPGTYDPELNLIYWGTGNPNPVYRGAGPQGRQSLDLLHRGAESGYRQNGLVFPGVAARYA